MKTKLFLLILAVIVGISTASAESGKCGANLTWDLTDGILTISGTGEMTDYTSSSVPWYLFRESIKTVIINDGITSIGGRAFYSCSGLTSVTIPESVTSIGNETFAYCYSLMNVVIPESVTNIGSNAFYGISNIIYKGDATGSPWGARYRNGFADGYFVYRDEKKKILLSLFKILADGI